MQILASLPGWRKDSPPKAESTLAESCPPIPYLAGQLLLLGRQVVPLQVQKCPDNCTLIVVPLPGPLIDSSCTRG